MTDIRLNSDDAVFGPVPSRRLGMSLGVDLLWPKTCTLDCRYCELGRTTNLTATRGRFRDAGQVLKEVETRIGELDYELDYVTLAGSGEPCLHLDMGMVLKELRRMTGARVAVLTNGTLCPDPAVRSELCEADVLIPSLDAVNLDIFRRLNRPAPGLYPEDIIEGLRNLRLEFSGEINLEMLLVQGMNDSPEEIEALVRAADMIAPDMVQLNTVVRPPAMSGTEALPHGRLEEIARLFTVPCEVIATPPKGGAGDRGSLSDRLVEMTRRRPLELSDVALAFELDQAKAGDLIEELIANGRMKRENFGRKVFYRGV